MGAASKIRHELPLSHRQTIPRKCLLTNNNEVVKLNLQSPLLYQRYKGGVMLNACGSGAMRTGVEGEKAVWVVGE